MIIIKNIWLIVIKDWIIIHLGKNPKNGGNPLKDKKEVNIINFNK